MKSKIWALVFMTAYHWFADLSVTWEFKSCYNYNSITPLTINNFLKTPLYCPPGVPSVSCPKKSPFAPLLIPLFASPWCLREQSPSPSPHPPTPRSTSPSAPTPPPTPCGFGRKRPTPPKGLLCSRLVRLDASSRRSLCRVVLEAIVCNGRLAFCLLGSIGARFQELGFLTRIANGLFCLVPTAPRGIEAFLRVYDHRSTFESSCFGFFAKEYRFMFLWFLFTSKISFYLLS